MKFFSTSTPLIATFLLVPLSMCMNLNLPNMVKICWIYQFFCINFIKTIYWSLLTYCFYPRQKLSSGIVVSGKKWCPAGGRASLFRFRTTVRKLLNFHLWNLAHNWVLCSSCAFWGSYCHCIYSFSIIMKNKKKLFFFVSGPELLNGCTYLHEILS